MRDKYNGGNWTPARFTSFVKGGLRGVSRRWPPKYECINGAFAERGVNPKTGRVAKLYFCAICNQKFPASNIQVDHIEPVIDPEVGFTSWDDVINRMFCEKENLQCLCKECHKAKTAQEKDKRKKK